MNRQAKRVLEHLMGPTGSVLVHLLIIFALIQLVFFESGGHQSDVEVIIMEIEDANLDELKKELKELKEIQQVDVITPPDISIDTEVLPEDVEEFDSTEPDVDFAALEVMDTVSSPLVIRGFYQGRSAGGRGKALREHAGKWAKYTEAAVVRALEWLKANQNEDGSWDKENQAGMTGLGLLTFLAHGETPTSEKYGPTVEKAIRWLIDEQGDSGQFSGNVYEQGIASYAVSEAYGLTQIPALKTAMDKGIQVIVSGQQPGGGWDYDYKQTPRRDTSVSGWQIQALKAAYIAGAEVEGVKAALDRSIRDFKKYQAERGKFSYSNDPDEGSIGMTGVGVLCMQLLGYAGDEACERGIAYLNRQSLPVDWEAKGGHDLYGWYYITQAKFHHGKDWSEWNSKFARAYTENQNSDGSWLAPGTEADKGKVYGTTFAALTLQVYYRLLPTYQAKAVESSTLSDEAEEDEEDLIEVI
jgi:hypothetical protein